MIILPKSMVDGNLTLDILAREPEKDPERIVVCHGVAQYYSWDAKEPIAIAMEKMGVSPMNISYENNEFRSSHFDSLEEINEWIERCGVIDNPAGFEPEDFAVADALFSLIMESKIMGRMGVPVSSAYIRSVGVSRSHDVYETLETSHRFRTANAAVHAALYSVDAMTGRSG